MAPCLCTRSPSHDTSVQRHAVRWVGEQREKTQAVEQAGPQGDPEHPSTPSPPWTIVAPSRWPARSGGRDVVTQPPRLDRVTLRLRVSLGEASPGFTPKPR